MTEEPTTAALTEAARLLAEGTGAIQAAVWVVNEVYLVPRGIAAVAVLAGTSI